MTDDVRRERLTQLRRVVSEAPADRFHMRSFYEKAECGTAYCAAGWAAVDPWFRENTEIRDIFAVKPDGRLEPLDDPFFELARLFSIDYSESAILFGGGLACYVGAHAVTKAEVIANIDRLLAERAPVLYAAFANH